MIDRILTHAHEATFVVGSLVGLVGSIMSVSLPIPNPVWLVYLPMTAAAVLTISFSCLLLKQPLQRELAFTLVFHALGAFSLFMGALGSIVTDHSHPYTYFLQISVIGSALLFVGAFGLIATRPTNPVDAICVGSIFVGCCAFLTASVIAISSDKLLANHACTIVAFAGLLIGSMLSVLKNNIGRRRVAES